MTTAHDNYKEPNIGKAVIIIFSLLAIAFGALFFQSCNPYKGISKREPQTGLDSVRLAKRFNSTFEAPKPRYLPGKTITKVIKSPADKKALDSLSTALDSVLNEIEGLNELVGSVPNIDSLKKAIKAEVMKQCKPTHTHTEHTTTDTIEVPDRNCEAKLFIAEKDGRDKAVIIEKKDAKIVEIDESRDWWRKVALILAGIIIAYIAIRLLQVAGKIASKIP
jgi:PBP1b-binding outer membrane lipoprotein LpoB